MFCFWDAMMIVMVCVAAEPISRVPIDVVMNRAHNQPCSTPGAQASFGKSDEVKEKRNNDGMVHANIQFPPN